MGVGFPEGRELLPFYTDLVGRAAFTILCQIMAGHFYHFIPDQNFASAHHPRCCARIAVMEMEAPWVARMPLRRLLACRSGGRRGGGRGGRRGARDRGDLECFLFRCEREAPKGRGRLREPPSAAGFHGAKLLPFYITFAAAALLPFYAKTRPLLPYPHPMLSRD